MRRRGINLAYILTPKSNSRRPTKDCQKGKTGIIPSSTLVRICRAQRMKASSTLLPSKALASRNPIPSLEAHRPASSTETSLSRPGNPPISPPLYPAKDLRSVVSEEDGLEISDLLPTRRITMSGEARARQSASHVCSARNVSRLFFSIDEGYQGFADQGDMGREVLCDVVD